MTGPGDELIIALKRSVGGLEGDPGLWGNLACPRVPSRRRVGKPTMRSSLARVNPIAMDILLMPVESQVPRHQRPASSSVEKNGAGRCDTHALT